jgi:hypothetical protein
MTYPVTIVLDRHGGTYSGGAWIAWPLYEEDIPRAPGGDEGDAILFWGNPRAHPYGRGSSPNEALAELESVPPLDGPGGRATYPVTIVLDRYGGTYSGGAWIAWPLLPEDIPGEPTGDDTAAIVFWSNPRIHSCGRGSTPNEALANLEAAPLKPHERAVDWDPK